MTYAILDIIGLPRTLSNPQTVLVRIIHIWRIWCFQLFLYISINSCQCPTQNIVSPSGYRIYMHITYIEMKFAW